MKIANEFTPTQAKPPARIPRHVPVTLAFVALAATALNLVALGLGRAAGASMAVVRPDGGSFTVEVPAILTMTLVPLLVGSIAMLLAHRHWPRGVRVLTWLGLAIGVATVPMALFSNGSATTAATLAAMHVIVGVVWFVGGRLLAPGTRLG